MGYVNSVLDSAKVAVLGYPPSSYANQQTCNFATAQVCSTADLYRNGDLHDDRHSHTNIKPPAAIYCRGLSVSVSAD